jgi:hypothetical protein
LTSAPPVKANRKRALISVVRSWLRAVITPDRAEYGMLTTVYASISRE